MTDFTKGWRKKRRGGKHPWYWQKTIYLEVYRLHRVGLCQWQVSCGDKTLPGITARREAMEKAHRHEAL